MKKVALEALLTEIRQTAAKPRTPEILRSRLALQCVECNDQYYADAFGVTDYLCSSCAKFIFRPKSG